MDFNITSFVDACLNENKTKLKKIVKDLLIDRKMIAQEIKDMMKIAKKKYMRFTEQDAELDIFYQDLFKLQRCLRELCHVVQHFADPNRDMPNEIDSIIVGDRRNPTNIYENVGEAINNLLDQYFKIVQDHSWWYFEESDLKMPSNLTGKYKIDPDDIKFMRILIILPLLIIDAEVITQILVTLLLTQYQTYIMKLR